MTKITVQQDTDDSGVRYDHSLYKRCPNCNLGLWERVEFNGSQWLRLLYLCPNRDCEYRMTVVVDRPIIAEESNPTKKPRPLDPHLDVSGTDPAYKKRLEEILSHYKGQAN